MAAASPPGHCEKIQVAHPRGRNGTIATASQSATNPKNDQNIYHKAIHNHKD